MAGYTGGFCQFFGDSLLNYPVARGKCRGKDLYGVDMWMYNKGSVINLRALLVQGKTVFSDMGQIWWWKAAKGKVQ